MNLPKGVVLINDRYLQVRILHNGVLHVKHFGPDTDEARQEAAKYYIEKKLEIRRGTFGVKTQKAERWKFDKAVDVYLKRHYIEYRDESTSEPRSKKSIKNATNRLRLLSAQFSRYFIDDIKKKDIKDYLRSLVDAGKSHGEVNKMRMYLYSIFSLMKQWVADEEVPYIQLPESNPVEGIGVRKEKPRQRILTDYEVSKIKFAFRALNDLNGLENFCLALKTCLSYTDLMKLKLGDVVDVARSKTGVGVSIPLTVTHNPSWVNWKKRWAAAVAEAGIQDIQFRDLRKTGLNWLINKFGLEKASDFGAHADSSTTKQHYKVLQTEEMRPLAEFISKKVDEL